jgi:hypothetical protein
LARYHFDYTDGEWYEFDAHGAELPSIAAAHQRARALAQDFVATHTHGAPDWYGWSVEVMDDAGRPVLSMPFRSAVQGSRSTDGHRSE